MELSDNTLLLLNIGWMRSHLNTVIEGYSSRFNDKHVDRDNVTVFDSQGSVMTLYNHDHRTYLRVKLPTLKGGDVCMLSPQPGKSLITLRSKDRVHKLLNNLGASAHNINNAVSDLEECLKEDIYNHCWFSNPLKQLSLMDRLLGKSKTLTLHYGDSVTSLAS